MMMLMNYVVILSLAFILGKNIDVSSLYDISDSSMADSSRICGSDESIEAKCYYKLNPKADITARAILRISKLGKPHCTGWIVSEVGHILTNYHCIKNEEGLLSLTFEAMAEGDNCGTNCRDPLACQGILVHTVSPNFVATGGSIEHDWTLLQLHAKDRQKAVDNYGYLKIRKSGPNLGEPIYLIGHPGGSGKRIAWKDGNVPATVISASHNTSCGKNEVIYKADTEGASSGSPVIALEDNLVIGIHHCGNCFDYGNSAVHVEKLRKGIVEYVPDSSFA
jgi:V8-like Glu-specific endopeptidase